MVYIKQCVKLPFSLDRLNTVNTIFLSFQSVNFNLEILPLSARLNYNKAKYQCI